jgi:hypothetical protein
MMGAQRADRTRQRLVVLLDHLIAHTQDHVSELTDAQGGLVDDAGAMRLLDHALADLATAQRSLGAFRNSLNGGDWLVVRD